MAKTKNRKTNVEYIKTQFFKSSETNKVVCELIWGLPLFKIPGIANYPDDFTSIFDETFKQKYSSYIGIILYNGTPYFAFKSNGSTVCAEGDTYNDTIGKRIALSKAQAKAFAISYRVYMYILNEYIKPDVSAMYNLIRNCNDVADDCKNHVNEIETNYKKN